jgi:hypothetical protein
MRVCFVCLCFAPGAGEAARGCGGARGRDQRSVEARHCASVERVLGRPARQGKVSQRSIAALGEHKTRPHANAMQVTTIKNKLFCSLTDCCSLWWKGA